MKSITIDARLINNSGIGTYIKNIVPSVIEYFHDLYFNILIDPRYKNSYCHPSFKSRKVNLIECQSNIYSLKEQIELYKVIPINTSIFWTPHYVVPVFYSKPMLVTIHDACHLALPEVFSGFQKRIYANLMYSVATKKASKIITDSTFSKQELIRYTKVKPELIDVIFLGVDFGLVKDSSRDDDSLSFPYIVFLGNVKPNKNLVRLLKAFSKLTHTIPHKLLIIGKKDGFICKDQEVFDFAESLGDRVEFTGFIDDNTLKKTLSKASALIFPSIYEGFGFPPLEAMSCGCPVAVSSAASIPEICGDAAIYFDPYNVDDIAEKIYQLVTNTELSKSLIEKGTERIKIFSWSQCTQETCKVIEELLKNC
jgi:glycosyltransferase involved in cell wall biosynthesis